MKRHLTSWSFAAVFTLLSPLALGCGGGDEGDSSKHQAVKARAR